MDDDATGHQIRSLTMLPARVPQAQAAPAG
jgi:hypothetical protein